MPTVNCHSRTKKHQRSNRTNTSFRRTFPPRLRCPLRPPPQPPPRSPGATCPDSPLLARCPAQPGRAPSAACVPPRMPACDEDSALLGPSGLLQGFPVRVVLTAHAGRIAVARRPLARGETVLEATPAGVYTYHNARRHWRGLLPPAERKAALLGVPAARSHTNTPRRCDACAGYGRQRLTTQCKCGAFFCSVGALLRPSACIPAHPRRPRHQRPASATTPRHRHTAPGRACGAQAARRRVCVRAGRARAPPARR